MYWYHIGYPIKLKKKKHLGIPANWKGYLPIFKLLLWCANPFACITHFLFLCCWLIGHNDCLFSERLWNSSTSASRKSSCHHHHRGDCHFVLAVYVCGLVNVDATSHMSLSCRPDQWRLTALCTLHTAHCTLHTAHCMLQILTLQIKDSTSCMLQASKSELTLLILHTASIHAVSSTHGFSSCPVCKGSPM